MTPLKKKKTMNYFKVNLSNAMNNEGFYEEERAGGGRSVEAEEEDQVLVQRAQTDPVASRVKY